ncbi:chemotaxis protein CheW [Lysobacter sp. H23M47]|uniref:chemotaxis protein CheW n=1 Tax=Lysobacter sp. H23M47 TaxID=2781024 RepID=UPI0018800902|nr:chemotaxis protein CheW [Lysobacter sp. H23M47]QOW24100.1 chemotaxis protein CheW [Lysobacter sp. H23M47]
MSNDAENPRPNHNESAPFDGSDQDIRGVLIQVAGARLLLPNATVAEVMSFAQPETVPGAPGWLLGLTRWRGWQVPLIGFSQLAGLADEQGSLSSKVLVLKALGGDPKAPYFAILSQGFPRLVTVSRAALGVNEDTEELPSMVLAAVRLNEDDAYVPDLVEIENLIIDTLSAAA